MDKIVSVVRCEDYDRDDISESVNESFKLIGGLGQFVEPSWRVLLKPNLLQPASSEKHITTHLEVISAVAHHLVNFGCEVTIAESPGFPYTKNLLKKLYKSSGLNILDGTQHISLNEDVSTISVPAPDGKIIKRFQLISPLKDVDAVVVVSKAKTHVLTGMTGGTKNLFGLVPGLEKSALHARLRETDDFCDMILDLNQLIRPKLQVMDAVVGLEGDGPSAGRPKRIGAILSSSNSHAIDVVTSRLMNMDPLDVATIHAAVRRGLLNEDLSDVKTVGFDPEALVVHDFAHPSTKRATAETGWRRIANPFIKPYSLRPEVMPVICNGCKTCQMICPKGAIHMEHGKAVVDYNACIRCYCCFEMCPRNAIKLGRSRFGRLIARYV